jgi:hypothetical protein
MKNTKEKTAWARNEISRVLDHVTPSEAIDLIRSISGRPVTPTPSGKPGPLESLKLVKYCQMCGNSDATNELEPAFNPSGVPMTLCRDCRIGSAELLAESRAVKPYVLIVVSGGVAELAKGSETADVDILDFDNLKEDTRETVSLSDREWEYLQAEYPEQYARLR